MLKTIIKLITILEYLIMDYDGILVVKSEFNEFYRSKHSFVSSMYNFLILFSLKHNTYQFRAGVDNKDASYQYSVIVMGLISHNPLLW